MVKSLRREQAIGLTEMRLIKSLRREREVGIGATGLVKSLGWEREVDIARRVGMVKFMERDCMEV